MEVISAMYASEQTEKMEREKLAALQLERLKKIVSHAYEKSAFYRRSFDRAGVKPDDLESLADVRKLPFLTLEEINRTDAFDFLTLPLSGIVRITHAEESDKEITKFYTKEDIRQNVEMSVRCLVASGVNKTSTVGLLGDLSDGKFLDILYALESIGATVLQLGTDYRRWLKMLENFGLDMLIGTPQLVMQLIIQLQATGKNIYDCAIKKILCVNINNIQNPLQQHMEMRAGSLVFNLFSPAELGTAGMIFQCSSDSGHHVQEDSYLAEIIRFADGKVLEEDEHMGELVITTLTAQAMPLIRYRTGQAVKKMREACTCGRTFIRIATPYTGLGDDDSAEGGEDFAYQNLWGNNF